jgi:hypothetical protein
MSETDRVKPARRDIDAADRRIDYLVYDLYGLTGEQSRLVEETTA